MIKICGEIVSPEYDCAFFSAWIENGAICPSNRVIASFDAVSENEPVSVFVDSPGGSVFAGDAIIIAARNAVKRGGCGCDVEIGSEACSMGAAFVAAMKADGARVRCHANSKVMFHSATVDAEGGADHLRDRAELVDNINKTCREALAKLGITETDEWFAEGREKWLNATEMLDLGIVDEIIEAPAASIDKDAVIAFRAAALARAAEPPCAAAEPPCAPSAAAAEQPCEPSNTADETPCEPPCAPSEKTASQPAALSPEDESWRARYQGVCRRLDAFQKSRVDAEEKFLSSIKALEKKCDEFQCQVDALQKDLATAHANASELSERLEKKDAALAAADEALAQQGDELAAAVDQVNRLEYARQLLTAGVLTASEGSSYAAKMAAAKTPEERESLRAQKRAGKIN